MDYGRFFTNAKHFSNRAVITRRILKWAEGHLCGIVGHPDEAWDLWTSFRPDLLYPEGSIPPTDPTSRQMAPPTCR